MKQEYKGLFLVTFTALLWSFGGLLIKYIPLSPMVLSSLRSILGVMVILVFFRKQKLVFNKTVFLSAFCLSYTMITFVIANRLTTAASAIVLQYCSPICVALYMFLIYKHKPQRNEVIALCGAFIGILLFFFGKFSGGSIIGNLIALSSGFSYGGLFLFNSRSDCDPFSSLILGQFVTFLAGVPFLFQEDYFVLSAGSIAALLTLGIVQVGLGYIFFTLGVKHISPLKANIICMIEPVLSPIWVFFFIGEQLTISAISGTVIVIGSVLFLNIAQAKDKNPE